MAAVAAILDFTIGTILSMFDLQAILILHIRFPTGLSVREMNSKIDFQDGSRGGHLGLLAICFLSLSRSDTSYQVLSGCHFGFRIGPILAILDLHVIQMPKASF